MGNLENDIRFTPLKDVVIKLHKRRFYDALLFGYIHGQKAVLDHITIPESIESFYKTFNVQESDYPKSACKNTYHRMINEFYEKS
jgi:hypothetical protein